MVNSMAVYPCNQRVWGARFESICRAFSTSPANRFTDYGDSGFETILVVEDEAPVLRLVAETLRSSGYSVLETDSAEALEMARGKSTWTCC
jgi:hypothetical protein